MYGINNMRVRLRTQEGGSKYKNADYRVNEKGNQHDQNISNAITNNGKSTLVMKQYTYSNN